MLLTNPLTLLLHTLSHSRNRFLSALQQPYGYQYVTPLLFATYGSYTLQETAGLGQGHGPGWAQ